jgi:hypothetical protein
MNVSPRHGLCPLLLQAFIFSTLALANAASDSQVFCI